jgi:hypothetical protein
MVDPNNWYQSKVHSGVAAVAEGALVVAGGVMAFVGNNGGEVAGPCVGLCVVAGWSRRCGSGSCVGPAGRAVLDGICHRRGRAFVARPCVGLCMGASVAAVDHVLVLSDVCARWAYVAKEEGRSSGCSGVCRRRIRAGVCRLAFGVWTVYRSGHGGVCAPWACGAQTQRRGIRTMCRSCAEAFVRPGTCVVQRRKLRRSAAR